MYDVVFAERSGWNECKAKEVYGCIVEAETGFVVCYVPSPKRAAQVLEALNAHNRISQGEPA